jgi:hypothetical protein
MLDAARMNDFQRRQMMVRLDLYSKNPHLFTQMDQQRLREFATQSGIELPEPVDTSFDLARTVKQAVEGYVSGFTTLKFGEEPVNEAENIARSLGHLAGFVGFFPGASLLKNLGFAGGARALGFLRGKSVPMLLAGAATKKASSLIKPLVVSGIKMEGALGEGLAFLSQPKLADIISGAFHLAVASGVSSWQEGIDNMMKSAVFGAVYGGLDRSLGNMIKTADPMADKITRGIIGSIAQGVPASLRGATTSQQIYEYTMGAYFGYNEAPFHVREGSNFIREYHKSKKNILDYDFDFEKIPGYKELSAEAKLFVLPELSKIEGTKEEVAAIQNQIFDRYLNKEGKYELNFKDNITSKSIMDQAEQRMNLTEEDIADRPLLVQLRDLAVKKGRNIHVVFPGGMAKIEVSGKADEPVTFIKNVQQVVEKVIDDPDAGSYDVLYIPEFPTTQMFSHIVGFSKKEFQDKPITEQIQRVASVDAIWQNMVEQNPGVNIGRDMVDFIKNNMPDLYDAKNKHWETMWLAKGHREAFYKPRRIMYALVDGKNVISVNDPENGKLPTGKYLAVSGYKSGIDKAFNADQGADTGESAYAEVSTAVVRKDGNHKQVDINNLMRGEHVGSEYGFFSQVNEQMNKKGYIFVGGNKSNDSFIFAKALPGITDAMIDGLYLKLEQSKNFDKGEMAVVNFMYHNELHNNSEASEVFPQLRKNLVNNAIYKYYSYFRDPIMSADGKTKDYGAMIEKLDQAFTYGVNNKGTFDDLSGISDNKRRQIPESLAAPIENSYWIQNLYGRENGMFRTMIIEDPRGESLSTDALAHEYLTSSDGIRLARRTILQLTNQYFGADENSGFTKSMVDASDPVKGPYFNKGAEHDMTDRFNEFFELNDLDFMDYKSSAKFVGYRKVAGVRFEGKKSFIFDKETGKAFIELDKATQDIKVLDRDLMNSHIHDIPMESRRVVYSVNTGESKAFKKAHIPRPLLTLVNAYTTYYDPKLTAAQNMQELIKRQEIVHDMFDELTKRSVDGTAEAAGIFKAAMDEIDPSKRSTFINQVVENMDDIPLQTILEFLHTGTSSKAHKDISIALRKKLLLKQKDFLERTNEEERGDSELTPDVEELVEQTDIVQRLLEIGGMEDTIMMSKDINNYFNTVLRNYAVERIVRPKIDNGASLIMRGYSIDNWFDPFMDQMQTDDNVFYFQRNMRNWRLKSNLYDKPTALGKMWDDYQKLIRDNGDQVTIKKFEDFFEAIAVRIPMDSMSGAQKLKFNGFTKSDGYAVVVHPRVATALGGADFDADKAFVFFGDKRRVQNGGKVSVRNHKVLKDVNVKGPNEVNSLRNYTTEHHYGNPFTGSNRGKGTIPIKDIPGAVKAYTDWLKDPDFEITDMNGVKHTNIKPEQRQWILDQVDSGALDGKTLLYYKPFEYYSHADALADFVNDRRGSGYTGHGFAKEWKDMYGSMKEEYYEEMPGSGQEYKWDRYSKDNYEVSTKGDKRFSALVAKLADGRTIEEHYQVDVKGYASISEGKGQDPKKPMTREEQWQQYKGLWKQYFKLNPDLLEEISKSAKGKTLTDMFASSPNSQARAISEILNETYPAKKVYKIKDSKTPEHYDLFVGGASEETAQLSDGTEVTKTHAEIKKSKSFTSLHPITRYLSNRTAVKGRAMLDKAVTTKTTIESLISLMAQNSMPKYMLGYNSTEPVRMVKNVWNKATGNTYQVEYSIPGIDFSKPDWIVSPKWRAFTTSLRSRLRAAIAIGSDPMDIENIVSDREFSDLMTGEFIHGKITTMKVKGGEYVEMTDKMFKDIEDVFHFDIRQSSSIHGALLTDTKRMYGAMMSRNYEEDRAWTPEEIWWNTKLVNEPMYANTRNTYIYKTAQYMSEINLQDFIIKNINKNNLDKFFKYGKGESEFFYEYKNILRRNSTKVTPMTQRDYMAITGAIGEHSWDLTTKEGIDRFTKKYWGGKSGNSEELESIRLLLASSTGDKNHLFNNKPSDSFNNLMSKPNGRFVIANQIRTFMSDRLLNDLYDITSIMHGKEVYEAVKQAGSSPEKIQEVVDLALFVRELDAQKRYSYQRTPEGYRLPDDVLFRDTNDVIKEQKRGLTIEEQNLYDHVLLSSFRGMVEDERIRYQELHKEKDKTDEYWYLWRKSIKTQQLRLALLNSGVSDKNIKRFYEIYVSNSDTITKGEDIDRFTFEYKPEKPDLEQITSPAEKKVWKLATEQPKIINRKLVNIPDTQVDISDSTRKGTYFEKDLIKFSNTTKLISRGSANSSSEAYRIAAEDKANPGKYSDQDIVGISSEGNRSGRVETDYVEVKKAIDDGVNVFVIDKASDRGRDYNIGERETAEFLIKNGFKEDGDTGVFIREQKPTSSLTIEYVGELQRQGFKYDDDRQAWVKKEVDDVPTEIYPPEMDPFDLMDSNAFLKLKNEAEVLLNKEYQQVLKQVYDENLPPVRQEAWESGLRLKDIQNPEVRRIYDELMENLTRFKVDPKFFEGFAKWVGGKNLTLFTLEDYRNMNRYFDYIKKPGIVEKLFSKDEQGIPVIKKLHYYLFPTEVNRYLMRYGFSLTKSEGVFRTQQGLVRGTVYRPTQAIEMLQEATGHWTEKVFSARDKYSFRFKSVMDPFHQMEGFDEVYKLMIAHRDKEYLDSPEYRKEFNKALREFTDKAKDSVLNISKSTIEEFELEKYFDKSTGNYKETEDTISKIFTPTEAFEMINRIQGKFLEKDLELIRGVEKIKNEFMESISKKNNLGKTEYWDQDAKEPMLPKIDEEKLQRFLRDAVNTNSDYFEQVGIDTLRRVNKSIILGILPNTDAGRAISYSLIKGGIMTTGELDSMVSYFPHVFDNKGRIPTRRGLELMEIIKDTRFSKMERMIAQNEFIELLGTAGSGETQNFKIDMDNMFLNMATRLRDDPNSVSTDEIQWATNNRATGNQYKRLTQATDFIRSQAAYEQYSDQLVTGIYKQLSLMHSRLIMESFRKNFTADFGDMTIPWYKYMELYVQGALNYPVTIPQSFVDDKRLNLDYTLYKYYADNLMVNKLNKVAERLGVAPRITETGLYRWSQFDAKWNMATLLFRPKAYFNNIYGGTLLNYVNSGYKAVKAAFTLSELQKINPEFKTMEDFNKFAIKHGVVENFILYEGGVSGKFTKESLRAIVKDSLAILEKNPDADIQDFGTLARRHKLDDTAMAAFSFFMRRSERLLRTKAFAAGYVNAYNKFDGLLAYDDPILVELGKKNVRATQFMYSGMYRPMFATSSVGKVMSRFQIWAYNSVQFQRDVINDARMNGFTPGTDSFTKFERMVVANMVSIALANVFLYSLFDSTLPQPLDWIQSMADWIFGNEKERDRAFFGSYPDFMAPAQLITPPSGRMVGPLLTAMFEDDWSKISGYYAYTMFPGGLMINDIKKFLKTPEKSVEAFTGIPVTAMGTKAGESVLGFKDKKGQRKRKSSDYIGIAGYLNRDQK